MKWLVFVWCFVFSLLVFGTDPKPNVIVILIDDMGYGDLSSFGNPKVKTPNMDWLAANGRKLTNYYAMSPVCSPSRSSLITGQYPATLGVNSIFASRAELARHDMPDFLPLEHPNLPRTMHEAGYATGHFGKWHMGGGRDVDNAPRPTEYGYDQSLVSFEGLGDRLLDADAKNDLPKQSAALENGELLFVNKNEKTGIYIDSALAFIAKHENEPFYIDLWPNDVHDWHQPKPGAAAEFDAVTENPYEKDFFAVLKAMDEQLGRFFQELERMGKMDNTIILLASDNGPTDWPRYYDPRFYPEGYTGPMNAPGFTAGFRGRKWSLYEGGIRVPFIAYWKGHIEASVDTKTMMGSIDLFPTICGLVGVQAAGTVEGQDMSKLLTKGKTNGDRTFYWYYEKPKPSPKKDSMRPELAMRSGEWKLISRVDGTESYLYNIVKDPYETNDLSESMPKIKARMISELFTWYNERMD